MLQDTPHPPRTGVQPPGAHSFTAHNIRLPDGSVTMPEVDWLIAESPWLLAAQRVLQLAFPHGFKGQRIADLGCLEGGYTVEFARMGFDAAGIEVRQSNFDNCLFVQHSLGLENLAFIKDDVWNIANHGPFDAIFCCGLLYHLDRPRQFIELMGRQARRVVIINTHYAPEPEPTEFVLSELTENEGLPGRWYKEYDDADKRVLETLKWTSWENRTSFWLKKEAILQCLQAAGFDLVFEQFDWLGLDIRGSMAQGYYRSNNRAMFVGVRSQTT